MILKGIIDNDTVNYKKISMVLEFPKCDFKCDRECGKQVCQNSLLATTQDIQVNIFDLIFRYHDNPLTEAVVCQGLEPMDSFEDLWTFITGLRLTTKDDIVIYTGYNKNEILSLVNKLRTIPNIIIKFGRYIPGQQPHYDEVLGVYLASDNQYGEKVS